MADRRGDTWKRHISEQLRMRDRVQRQAFEEIISQCKRGSSVIVVFIIGAVMMEQELRRIGLLSPTFTMVANE